MNTFAFHSLSADQLRTLLSSVSGGAPQVSSRGETIRLLREKGYNRVRMDWVPVSKGGRAKVSTLTLIP